VTDPTTTQLAFAAYRPPSGSADDLMDLLREELATLRRRGHVTGRRAPVARTQTGDVLVVLEWSTEHAVDDAHADPEVLAVWDRKARLAEYIPLPELSGSDAPFARWTVVADL
jgi:hypothetical protein